MFTAGGVGVSKASHEFIAWLRELFIHYGRILRHGDKSTQEIENFIECIPEKTLTNAFSEMLEPHNVEHEVYTYNKDLDYCFENECEEKEEYEEFVEDIDEMARNILLWRDEYDCILTVLDMLSTENENLLPIWREYFRIISDIDGFLRRHIYVRPEMAQQWEKFALRAHIPQDSWWAKPGLIENRPILLPLEKTLLEIEACPVTLPEHIRERTIKKLFPEKSENYPR